MKSLFMFVVLGLIVFSCSSNKKERSDNKTSQHTSKSSNNKMEDLTPLNINESIKYYVISITAKDSNTYYITFSLEETGEATHVAEVNNKSNFSFLRPGNCIENKFLLSK